jgi:acyl-coenzyme A thioesterase PaaI-like protein
MDVTELPFNRLIGLERAAPESGYLLALPAASQYLNHLGTVHASALLALAEAGSGEFLLRHFGNVAGLAPVVRRLEAKFRRPARGRVFARVASEAGELARVAADLEARGRVTLPVAVEVVDENQTVVLAAVVEWVILQGGGAGSQPQSP